MKIDQHQHSHHHSFVFEETHLQYTCRHGPRLRMVEVVYSSLSPRTSSRVEQNRWLYGLGLAACLVGVVLTGLALSGMQRLSLAGSLWLPLGLSCVAWARLTRMRFTVFHTRKGEIHVIRNHPLHDAVVSELRARRERQLLEGYSQPAPTPAPGVQAADQRRPRAVENPGH